MKQTRAHTALAVLFRRVLKRSWVSKGIDPKTLEVIANDLAEETIKCFRLYPIRALKDTRHAPTKPQAPQV